MPLKIPIVRFFAVFNIHEFYEKFVGTFITYLHINIHIGDSSDPFVTTIVSKKKGPLSQGYCFLTLQAAESLP